MTLQQEAYKLLQEQPESNIKIIIELLRAMTPKKTTIPSTQGAKSFKRTGVGKGILNLPEDFGEHIDDDNAEIAKMFYGGEV